MPLTDNSGCQAPQLVAERVKHELLAALEKRTDVRVLAEESEELRALLDYEESFYQEFGIAQAIPNFGGQMASGQLPYEFAIQSLISQLFTELARRKVPANSTRPLAMTACDDFVVIQFLRGSFPLTLCCEIKPEQSFLSLRLAVDLELVEAD